MTKLTWEELVEYIGVAGWTVEDIVDEITKQPTHTFILWEDFKALVDEGQELRKQFDKDTKGMRTWNE